MPDIRCRHPSFSCSPWEGTSTFRLGCQHLCRGFLENHGRARWAEVWPRRPTGFRRLRHLEHVEHTVCDCVGRRPCTVLYETCDCVGVAAFESRRKRAAKPRREDAASRDERVVEIDFGECVGRRSVFVGLDECGQVLFDKRRVQITKSLMSRSGWVGGQDWDGPHRAVGRLLLGHTVP